VIRRPWLRTGFCWILLSTFLIAWVSVDGQTATATPALSGIAHAAIRVSDLARSRAFYEKLGFEEAFAMDKGGTPTEAFLKINDRQFIELYPQRDASQPIGFMHVCFESADLEALNRDYLARGLTPTPVRKAGAGNLLFTMQGPERQNIEYTQYMPGSKHTNDVGLHLGVNRISTQIVGLGIEMQDPAAAKSFYEQKLGFRPAQHAFEAGFAALEIPGDSGEQIEFIPRASGPTFRLVFAVTDLSRAAAQLKALQPSVIKHESELAIQDPDGNIIVFVKSGREAGHD
jgi:catechol 2,3-dioxygenase-like lactoylglutathione lyase family enzyme